MNSFVLVKNGNFVTRSLPVLRENRPGVAAALLTMLLFIVGCGGSSKPAAPKPSFTPDAGTYATAQNVTVSDTDQNAVLYCTIDGSTPTTSSPQCPNPIKVSQSETLSAIAIAPGMSPSAIATAAYTIGISASLPMVTAVTPASGPAAGGTTVTIAGTNFTGATAVNFGAVAVTNIKVNSANSITAVAPGGSGSVHVTVVTGAGTSATSSADLFTYVPAPAITGINPTSGIVGTSVTITGTNFGAAQGTSVVTFNGTAATSVTSWSPTSIVAVVPAGATTGNLVVTVNGVASNGVSFAVTVPVPAVTLLTPNSGAVGIPVAIIGTNFGATQGTNTVTFNGTAATSITSWSPTSIVAVVPAGATTGNVVVTVSGVASNGTPFTVTTAPPTITLLNPASGAAGTSVAIIGTNFGAAQGTSTVTFNGTAATSITSWSPTSIVAAVPAGATTGNVVVTVNGAASNGTLFTVNGANSPTIASLSPTSGVVGSSVTITGTNFGSTQGTSTISFNGTTAASITSWSPTSIVAIVPSGATTGNVVVTVNGTVSNGVPFTVTTPPPTIASLNPTSGAVGDAVTITGTNFGSTQGSSTVTFNGTAATSITSWSDTSIVAAVPAGATTGNVVVTINGIASNTEPFTVASGVTIHGTVKDGVTAIAGATVTLYAAASSGYGASPTLIATADNPTDSTGAFAITTNSCPAAPGDQLYLVATGGNAGPGANSQSALMAALGSCNGSAFPSTVTLNEVTTVASAYALSAFANVDAANGGIDVGAPATHDNTNAPKCDASDGWQSTGPSTCNYIGLKNAFAVVNNLVDLPSGQALAVTPAYCTSQPCTVFSTSTTTPYYATSIVPQGRINALANALASCVNSSGAADPNDPCGTLFTATAITTPPAPNSPIVTAAPGTTITPKDTLQAVLNMAHCPGDSSITLCGVNVFGAQGILSLIPAKPVYQPTLTTNSWSQSLDLTLALVFQGAGVGGAEGAAEPEAAGLAIDGTGNVWVPTISSSGGSVAVFNNLGAPISPSGSSASSLGGYTTGVYNPQSIAIDQNGNAWIGNSPADGKHGLSDNGSLSEIKLDPSTLTLSAGLSGLTSASLLTPAPYGVAIDSNGNPWVASNPGGTGNATCGSNSGSIGLGTTGGSVIEFDSGTGSVLNTSLQYSDNSSCPTAVAVDHNGYLWVADQGRPGGSDPNLGLLQLDTSSGSVVGGPYNADLQNNPEGFGGLPVTLWNLAIDGAGDAWLFDNLASSLDGIPSLTGASASQLSSGTWGVSLLPSTFANLGDFPFGSAAIDGAGNVFGAGNNQFLVEYPNIGVNPAGSPDTTMLSPNGTSPIGGNFLGYNGTDLSQNASGRATGGTLPFFGGYSLDGSMLGGLNGFGLNPYGAAFISSGVDGSGNLWISSAAVAPSSSVDIQGSQLTEFVGIATPTATPLTTGAGIKP